MATPERNLWQRIRRLTEPQGAGETAAMMGAAMAPGVGVGMDAVDLAAGIQDRDLLRAGIGAVGLTLPVVSGMHLKALMHGIGRFMRVPAILEQGIKKGSTGKAAQGSTLRQMLTRNTKSGMSKGERDWRISSFIDDEPVGHRSFRTYDQAIRDLMDESRGGPRAYIGQGVADVEPGRVVFRDTESIHPAGHGIVTDLNVPLRTNATSDEYLGSVRLQQRNLRDTPRRKPTGIASLPGVLGATRRSMDRSFAEAMPTADDIARGRALYDPYAIANFDPYKDWYSHSLLIDMDPRDFRRLSYGARLAPSPKMADLDAMVREGILFNEIPYLLTSPHGNGFVDVMGHEGRHRSLLASRMGINSMPVRIYGNFDMFDDYGFDPMYFRGQEKRWRMPFPFTREQLRTSGKPRTPPLEPEIHDIDTILRFLARGS